MAVSTKSGNRIIPALTPRMASHNTPSRHVTAAPRAMFAQRNPRIVRTGRREAALAAEIGAKDKLIAADKRRQQPRRWRHQLTRSRILITTVSSRAWSSPRSVPREVASRPSSRDLKLTSTLRGENAARWTRKVSLTNRLIRLRATEDLISRLGTDIAIAPNFPAS